MKKNLLTIFFLSFLALTSALAQNRTITGKVTSADDGQTIPGVSVKVQGSSIGTQTNLQGEYTINVPESAKVLFFSFVGYSNQTIVIGAQKTINVKLSSDAKALTEVVVVGYGTAKKASDAPGFFKSVSSSDIQDKPVANALDALQGRVAGLTVFNSSGEPSATQSLSIHGTGSLTASSTPLVVLDGVQIDPTTVLTLNPDDIESVTVLKDAASTSIYGARAANGVLYITTKKGIAGKPNISFTSEYGVSKLASNDFFNSFMNTAQFTKYLVDFGQQTQAQVNTTLQTYNADTKWYKVYYKDNTGTFSNNLSLSGGSDKTTYFVSGSFFRQDGLAYRSLYDRYTLRSNVTSNVTKWLQFGLNLSAGYDDRQSNPYGTNSTNRGLALLAAPYYSPTDANGNNYNFIPGWGRYHPQYLANENPDPQNKTLFDPVGYIQLTPIKGLTIRSQGGLDAYDLRETATRLPSYIGSLNNGSVAEFFTRGVSKTFTNTAEYKFSVKDIHHITALVGQEYQDGDFTSFSGSSTGQTDDRILTLGAGTTGQTVNSARTEYDFKSLFSRLEYDYNSKYFLEGSIRQDKSSRFGVNKQTGKFYSVGATWNAKKENFLKDVSWLSELSVKATTGTTGNAGQPGIATDNYQALAKVSTLQYNGSGFQISTPGNPNLSWETQQLTTLGFTTELFDSRLRLDFSYYIRKTSDMLIDVPFPLTTGFSTVTQNTGTLQNKGFDIDLQGDVYRDNSHRAYLTPYVVVNINHNKVTSLFQGRSYWILPNTGVSWAVGQEVTYIYPVWAGVNSQTGLPQWYNPDPNPDNVVNKTTTNGVTNTFSSNLQQSTGLARYAWLNGSFGLRGAFEGFSFDAQFIFSKGKNLINNDRYFFENPNQFPNFNQTLRVLDYWKNPGDQTLFPKLGTQFTQFDSRLIEDASFIRLKSLSLGYNLPKSFLQKTNVIKGVKVFLVGRNLITWTKYLGPDPEVDSNLTLGVNPNTKQYSMGLQITF